MTVTVNLIIELLLEMKIEGKKCVCVLGVFNVGEKVEDLRKAFRLYENDGTDCITPKSLNRVLDRLGESRSVDECVGMINQFDLNGDGVLNFDEFKAMML